MSAVPNAGTNHIPASSNQNRLQDLAERAIDTIDRKLPDLEGKLDAKSAELAQSLLEVRGMVDEIRHNYREFAKTHDRNEDFGKSASLEDKVNRSVGEVMWDSLEYFRRGYRGLPEKYQEAAKRFRRRAADQTEETESIGGITVPTLTTTEIAYYQRSRGLARKVCRTGFMRSDKQDVPVVDDGVPTVYYVTSGNAPAANSVVTFITTKQLQSKTIMAVQLLEQELLEDTTADDFEGFWSQVFLDQFLLKEDRAVFSETATDSNSAFTGAVQAVDAYGSGSQRVTLSGAHFSTITYDNLCQMQSLVADGAAEDAIWVGSRATLRHLQAKLDSQNRPLIQNMWQGMYPYPDPKPDFVQGIPTMLLGSPYFTTPAMPTDVSGAGKVCLIYGSFKKGHYFFERKRIEIGFSPDAAYGTGGIMFRMRERVASLNVLSAGFSVAKNA